jgi:hypothetical protein
VRVVLHMGAPKTATTYIQHVLGRNIDELAAHSVYLPTTGRFEFANRSVVHHHLAYEIVEPTRFSSDQGGWEQLRAELADVHAETVVLSSEAFERATFSAATRRELIRRLREIADDITIVYVVRDQLSQLNSLYAQNIKSLRSVDPFARFVRRSIRSGRFDLDAMFRPWYGSERVKLVVMPFDGLVETDPAVAFLHAVGIDVSPGELWLPEESSNESLSPIGIEAARLLGQYLRAIDPAYDHRTSHGQRLYRAAAAEARSRGWNDTKYWGWSPRKAKQSARRFKQSNTRFARAVWGTPWPMELPVTRERNTADVLTLSSEQFADVQDYVRQMAATYADWKRTEAAG